MTPTEAAIERARAHEAAWAAKLPVCHLGTVGCRDRTDNPHECRVARDYVDAWRASGRAR